MKLGDELSLVRQKMDRRGVMDGAKHFCGGETVARDHSIDVCRGRPGNFIPFRSPIIGVLLKRARCGYSFQIELLPLQRA